MDVEVLLMDITKIGSKADAIVNAANESLLGGGGVDGAIHRAAGPELLKECITLDGCKPGEAKATKGYNLNCKFIIHTVGPRYWSDPKPADTLHNCYVNSLMLADSLGLKTIAFPSISTGAFGYPIEEAAKVSAKALFGYKPKTIEKVYICIYPNKEDVKVYESAFEARELKNKEKQQRIDYLNRYIKEKESFVYSGPGVLYKYRKFDQYTFDMLENKYIYLCPADKLDDETECVTTINANNLFDMKANNLKRTGLELVLQMIKPYCKADRYEEACQIIYRTSMRNGAIRNNYLLDMMPELQEMFPGTNIAPFYNLLANLPDKLDELNSSGQIQSFIMSALKREKIGVFSMAERNDIEDLWYRYGNKHAGYCIEYEIGDYAKKQQLFPVIYEYERENNVIFAIVNNFICQFISVLSDNQIKPDVSQYLRLFISKYVKWEEQSEWRVIGLAETKPSAPKIKRIIVGSKASEDDKSRMIAYCKEHDIVCVEE